MKTIFHFHLIVISSVLLSADSCNRNKNTATSSTTTTQTNTTTTVATQQPMPVNPVPVPATKDDGSVRFSASFFSIGEGIDTELHKKFIQFLDSYPKKIAYSPIKWGREGETDYCIALKELTEIEQEEFVRKAKKILSTNVDVNENTVCSHKKTGANDEKYRLIISFFSIGEGINLKTNEEFEKFLSSYTPKIKHELITWGREGEKDYCFKLTELTDVQQEEFVRKAKEVTTKKVHIKENEKCTR